MNYPLLSEYVESIRSAEDNLAELSYLHPVLDANGNPVMTGGNFAVVFKMQDKNTGKYYALKCFTKEQEGRAESYKLIAEELELVNTTYFTHFKYYDKELFVDCGNSDETEFPVVLMDWVEGITLDKYIRTHIDDKYELSLLAYQFSRLAMWLIPQPFAHGDLKPDNILVQGDGTLVLVDYDGMYVPAMKGQKARELGIPDFRHPSRTEDDFNEHIDDFALASILLSLKAISLNPDLLDEYGASDRLLFSELDYHDIGQSKLLRKIYPSNDSELNILLSLFTIAHVKSNLSDVSFRLLYLSRPIKQEVSDEDYDAWLAAWTEEQSPYEVDKIWSFQDFINDFSITKCIHGNSYYSVSGGGEDAYLFIGKDGKKIVVFNQSSIIPEYIGLNKNEIVIELRKSGHYILCDFNTVKKEPIIVGKWTFVAFAKSHGKPMLTRPLEFVNSKTGESFTARSVAFEHPTEMETLADGSVRNKICFVGFSSKLGELTAEEIAAQVNELDVVEYENGNYGLMRREADIFYEKNIKFENIDNLRTSVLPGDLYDIVYKQIKQCASELLLSLEDKGKTDLDKNLLYIELTILTAASVSDYKKEEIYNWHVFLEQKIFNDYLSIKEVDNYDILIERNNPCMYSDGFYAEEAMSLAEFEKENGQVKFFKGNINAYPYDDSFWGEFVDKNGQKQIIYVDQGFIFEYSASDILKDKCGFGIVEQKGYYKYNSDCVFYCLKKIKKKHSMLSFYISQRLSSYEEIIKEAMSNRKSITKYSIQLYNTVTNGMFDFDEPSMGIDDMIIEDDFIVNKITAVSYPYTATSMNRFSMCVWDKLSILRQEFDKTVKNL